MRAKRLLTSAFCPLLSLFAENNDKSIVKYCQPAPKVTWLGPKLTQSLSCLQVLPLRLTSVPGAEGKERRRKRWVSRFFLPTEDGVGFHKADVKHTLQFPSQQFPSSKHIWIPERVFQVEAPLGQAIVVLMVWENPVGFMPDSQWVKNRILLAWPEFSFTCPTAGKGRI